MVVTCKREKKGKFSKQVELTQKINSKKQEKFAGIHMTFVQANQEVLRNQLSRTTFGNN